MMKKFFNRKKGVNLLYVTCKYTQNEIDNL